MQARIHAHTDLHNLCLLHMSVSLQQNYITSVHLTQQKLDVQARNFTKQTNIIMQLFQQSRQVHLMLQRSVRTAHTVRVQS